MESQGEQGLLWREQRALSNCLTQMNSIDVAIRDLESVHRRLTVMPEKTHHKVMVPIGTNSPQKPPLLLMPGYVKHTNEILVLLGDNWFVERSAKEASEIAERRINKAKDIKDQLKKEMANHEQWIKTFKQLLDEKADHQEIREEFDEKAESEWKVKHRQNVREAKMKEKKEKDLSIDEDLMKRLQELELQEEQNEENESPFDWRQEVAKMEEGREDKKKVRFKEEVTLARDEEQLVQVPPEKVPEPIDAIGSVVEREAQVPARPPKAPRGGKGKSINSSFGKFNK